MAESSSDRLQNKVSQMERLAELAKQHRPIMGIGGDKLAYMQTMSAYNRLAESIEKEREEDE
ncbi:hypothetical protein HUG15_05560 [Salicibibacter cibarius]|uniref:Uncharacterized protein n=2 Tax=Salicibibacter cibarius TaxID=2743000 RepID=A0A7T7CAR5_9BACI|nr:hypothetical protein HUG15_05225 [Salicibibacter cibarius]QQK75123.1 hypothetical protein HUG15_05560 [Salicibibacter cibarius]